MIQLALGFAFLDGYCDAISFFLVGTFTGHVTGNSVLAAMRVALFDARGTLACSLAILFFLAGTFLGARLAQTLAGRSERFILQATMGVEVALILVGYLAVSGTSPIRNELYIAALALAMGLQNGAFRRANGLTVHTTCVSGMFTNVVTDFAISRPLPAGDPPNSKLSAQSQLFGGIFVFFVFGALVGALIVSRFHANGVLGGVLLLLVLAGVLRTADR